MRQLFPWSIVGTWRRCMRTIGLQRSKHTNRSFEWNATKSQVRSCWPRWLNQGYRRHLCSHLMNSWASLIKRLLNLEDLWTQVTHDDLFPSTGVCAVSSIDVDFYIRASRFLLQFISSFQITGLNFLADVWISDQLIVFFSDVCRCS